MMKSTIATLSCLFLLVPALAAQTVEDDIKAIREELRTRNASGPYIGKHAEKRIKDWRAAAEKGDAQAQWLLGRCYLQGVGGLKEDAEEGAKWVKKSAEQGFGIAENNLGLIYEDGEGVDRDAKEAFRWVSKSAERGEFIAQYNLGRLHREGVGTKKNIEESLKW